MQKSANQAPKTEVHPLRPPSRRGSGVVSNGILSKLAVMPEVREVGMDPGGVEAPLSSS